MIGKFYWLTAISFLLLNPSTTSIFANSLPALTASIESSNSIDDSNFLDFKGVANKCAINLEWRTTQASNLSYFELERANGNGAFRKIATIRATHNDASGTLYFFEDYSVRLSTHFRIKGIRNNGDHEYSKIINVLSSCGKKKVLIEAYSKPVTETITIHAINNQEAENCVVEIYESLGEIVFRKSVSLKTGFNTLDLSNSIFIPDDYYVQLIGDGWKSKPKRIRVD